jgi:hypothetical protein
MIGNITIIICFEIKSKPLSVCVWADGVFLLLKLTSEHKGEF